MLKRLIQKGPTTVTTRLVAFDFDGTLAEAEMTVLLGEAHGVAPDIEAITDRAMRGEIAYAESLRERVRSLAGLDIDAARTALDRIDLRPGTVQTIHQLRAGGVHVVILTGGFERGVERALDRGDVTVDAIRANRLQVADGQLTGEVSGPLIETEKDEVLREVCRTFDVDLEETVAVGDGANDIPMLEAAGHAIGFHPKPAVEPSCDTQIDAIADLLAHVTWPESA